MRPEVPKTMKACVATGFGEIGQHVFVRESWPTPNLPMSDDQRNEKHGKSPEFMLVKVLACALAPGDVRVLSGNTDYMQMPPGGLPYIPGSDVAAIVVETHPDETKFQVGDYVICRFDEPKPHGGLAEYRVVHTRLSEKCPASIPPIVACGLSASAMAAKRVVRDFVKPNDRVLIVGGSGAVGSSMLQYCRHYQAGYVATVSTQSELCQRLGAHRVIDYRSENWWEVPEFQKEPFDVVVDLVNGGRNWQIGGCSGRAIKRNGVYVALLSGVQTEIVIHNMWGAIGMMFVLVGRVLYSRLHPRVPKYVLPEALKLEDSDLKGLMEDVVNGTLEPVLDPVSPLDFSEDGLRKAFEVQKSRHAHGKVVVGISP